MDYILSKINQRISILQMTEESYSLAVHYRSRIEYLLTFMLGYLWNKNFNSLESDEKLAVFNSIIRPTLGNVVSVCRTLDLQKDFFSNKIVAKAIDKYPDLRNNTLGHGFVFEDKNEKVDDAYVKLFEDLVSCPNCLFSKNYDYIYIQKKEKTIYKGIKYTANGDIRPWSAPIQLSDFNIGELYIFVNNKYFSVSPFIRIDNSGDSIFIYSKVVEKILGKIRYNKLINTDVKEIIWEPFSHLCVVNDGLKEKTANGTIRNIYENNYRTYIDVGVKSQILKFLKENKASVCATLWGHGGIGKTATIQNVCDVLSNNEYKTFDYIVFISAKDRRYNYYKGIIESVNTDISTYNDVIKTLNVILFEENSVNEQSIIEFDGLLLLVLDDFESFAKEEASKLSNFISHLNINHHKVVVTTRSANVSLGHEIKTNELDVSQTAQFLNTFIINEGIPLSINDQNSGHLQNPVSKFIA